MTTIVDPNGTPDVIYCPGDVTFEQLSAAGSNEANATVIVAPTSFAIIAVTATADTQGLKLPEGNAGDIIELYKVGAENYRLYKANGDLYRTGVSSILLRHLGANGWHYAVG